MAWYKVYGGVSNWTNAPYHGVYECKSEEDAMELARELAIEDYESYAGLHGIPSWEDVREDYIDSYGETPRDEEVDEIYFEERESWITYYVKLTKDPSKESNDNFFLDEDDDEDDDEEWCD